MSEKSEKIYEAVTNVSDELVEAAGGRKRPRRAWYIGAVAALLVVAIAVALIRPGAGGSALAIAEAVYEDYERLPDGVAAPDACFEALTAQFLSGAGEENALLSPVNLYMALAMLAELTEFYSAQEEPVLLLFFGDHLPYLGDNRQGYIELGLSAAEIYGGEDPYAAYTAPFLLWCNEAAAQELDFEAAIEALELPGDGRISACYLGAAVLELCGRGEVSPWFGYLNEMRRELPIMHGGVFETADGALTTELSGEQAQLLSKMRCWAYYKLRYGTVG